MHICVIYRRTRRQSPQKMADHTENYNNLMNVGEKRLNTEQKPMKNLHNNMEKAAAFHQMKEFKDTIGVGSTEQCFRPQNSSSIHLEDNEKGHKNINQDNCIARPAKHSKHLSNRHSDNFNVEKGMRNLKRPFDSLAQSTDVPNEATAFVVQNESENGNMPVILNVFTLSQDPTSYTKQKTINRLRENDFPVTPPCSPPLKPVQFIGTRNTNSCSEIKTAFTSICSTHPFLNEFAIESKSSYIYSPVRHHQENINNGGLPVLNEFMDQRNYTAENQTTSYNVNCADQAKENSNNVIHSSNRSVPMGRFTRQEHSPSYSGTQTNYGSKNYAINGSHVFLSPRDVKVLELKKRLQEQEAALKKLRAKH